MEKFKNFLKKINLKNEYINQFLRLTLLLLTVVFILYGLIFFISIIYVSISHFSLINSSVEISNRWRIFMIVVTLISSISLVLGKLCFKLYEKVLELYTN